MEDDNIGTKATRSNIVDTLFRRGYIRGQRISITDIGVNVIEALAEYSPDIIDVQLTRNLEEQLEAIQSGDISPDEVIQETITTLDGILTRFKEKEHEIAESLAQREGSI